MKFSKERRTYCPFCRKHQKHKVVQAQQKGLSKTHTMSHGATPRVRARGRRRGFGNLGRFSRKAISAWKRVGSKTTKKTNMKFKCTVCGKEHIQAKGFRARKIEIK